jgi:hypothetical protein
MWHHAKSHMNVVLIINSDDLRYARGSPEQLQNTLGRLQKRRTLVKALQFAAALGTDVEQRYRTVDRLLSAAAPEDLKTRIDAVRQANVDKHFVFFEPWQQLLIARHVSRFGSDDPNALDLETVEGRALFFEACRIVNDLSMPPAPPLTGNRVTDGLIVAANTIPRLWLMNPPNLNDAQARLLAFLEVIPQDHPERADAATMLRNRFREDLGVGFDDALDLTSFLGYWSVAQNAEDILRDVNVVRVAPNAWLQHTNFPRETFDSFVTRISQPAEGLSPDAPPGAGSAWFDPLAFRDRPLVRFDDATLLVTMPELLMEKAGFDMLWWLTAGPGGRLQVRAWQEAFGQLCETYVLDLLQSCDGGAVLPNVEWEQGEIDALSWSGDRLAVVEICSGFMANAPKMSGDSRRLRDELRRRYVEHTNANGQIEREAVSQLVRDIEWLLACRRSGGGPPVPLHEIQTIHPVVIAADRAARTQNIWRYLDSELIQRLPGHLPWQVAPLAVLGLEDLEWIEQASRDDHERLQGVLPPVLQTLRWWQFDVQRYHAFWQLLGDYLGEGGPNVRLRELFQRRRERMQARFRPPPAE